MMRLLLLFTLAAAAVADEYDVDKLFTTSANQFTSRMFTEVVKNNQGKSVVLSAFSVMPPLAQLALASAGESHDELLRSIGMPNDNVTKAAFSELNTKLSKSSKDVDLRMANKIYIAKSYELNDEFAHVSRDVFKSEAQNIDFLKSAESANEINTWVEDQTNHRIKDLVEPSMFDETTKAVLVNAIYFKGSWKYPFKKEFTRDSDFHVSKKETVKVPLMYTKNDYKYVDSKELNAQVIEIPYVGEDASMMIVLPKEIDGITELEEKLKDPSVLENVAKNMYETEVEVHLPKFKIETTTNLKVVLENMDVKRMFTPSARLENLLKGTSNLYVSEAIQKAFIEVNEEGAEAAAANAFVQIVATSLLINTAPTPVFKADHPFYFAIKVKSVPLFTGIKIIGVVYASLSRNERFIADRPFYFMINVNSLPLFNGVMKTV